MEEGEYFIRRVGFRDWCFSQLKTDELATATIGLYSRGSEQHGYATCMGK